MSRRGYGHRGSILGSRRCGYDIGCPSNNRRQVWFHLHMCTKSAMPEPEQLAHRYKQQTCFLAECCSWSPPLSSGAFTRNGTSEGNDWCVLSFGNSGSFTYPRCCRSGSQLTRRQWAYAFALVTTLFFTCELCPYHSVGSKS